MRAVHLTSSLWEDLCASTAAGSRSSASPPWRQQSAARRQVPRRRVQFPRLPCPRRSPQACSQPPDRHSRRRPQHPHPRHPARIGSRSPYVNALEDYLAAYSRADEAGDPSSPDLSRYSSGPALAWARQQIGDHVKLGVTHRGFAAARNVGAVDVTSRSARVGQCMDWSTWPVLNRTTGATYQQFPQWSQLVYADVAATGGQWRVQRITVKATAC